MTPRTTGRERFALVAPPVGLRPPYAATSANKAPVIPVTLLDEGGPFCTPIGGPFWTPIDNDVQESEDGLVVSDAIERHGFVRRQGSCLVVDYSGQEYSPVFRTPATFDATLQSATAKPSAPLQLLGGPLSKVRRGFSEELAEFCGRPLFLLVGITPSVFHNPVVPGKAR